VKEYNLTQKHAKIAEKELKETLRLCVRRPIINNKGSLSCRSMEFAYDKLLQACGWSA
jgi:hypothetical protein